MLRFLSQSKVPVISLAISIAVAGTLVGVHSLAAAKSSDPGSPGAGQGQVAGGYRQGVANRVEANRRTNPRRVDSDRDGLSDRTEINRTRTNPRKADSDGDGVSDGAEVLAGSDPRNPASIPKPQGHPGSPLPPDSGPAPPDPPVNATWDSPAGARVDVPVTLDGSASTGPPPLTCTWSFESQNGSIVWQTRSGCTVDFNFEAPGTKYVRLSVEGANGATSSNMQPIDVAPPTGGEPQPDTSPPNTTIASGPSATTTATVATVAFSSNEPGSSFQCQLDGSGWSACSTPTAYFGLAVGSHTFSVRAIDPAGNADPTPATRNWTVETPTIPPSDTIPPDTAITSAPPAATTASSAGFSFESTEPGSTFACKLDGGAFGPCSSPRTYTGLTVGEHTFTVRATDAAGNPDPSPASRIWVVESLDEPPPPPQGSCAAGASTATSAAAVTAAVSSGNSVCVTAAIGNVDFGDMGNRSGVVISTDGGSIGEIEIIRTTGLIVRSARFESVTIRGGDRTTIENSTIGGTRENRILDQLIFMPDASSDVTIRNNDIGWTRADNSGNTGYGCRCYGTLNRLRFVGNKLHDLAADGFQGVGGSDVLIDRNEIGPVGANPGSSEHSDNIQITGNGPNLQITNNWIHHQGYYEGQATGNAGSTYIHGGESNSLVYENNLIEATRGRTEVCGLGTGGTSRSNITIRNNTWIDGGQAFSGFPGFEWDCDSGTGNIVERNIAIDPDGGFAQSGSAAAATFSSNLWGQPSLITVDAQGNCTSANCNPSAGAIGYRKPSGVRW